MATFNLTKENLRSSVEENQILLVDFWGPNCAPCKMFGPIFEKVSDANPDIAFAKCDTQAEPEVAAVFGIQSIPTLAVFKDQVLIFLQPGALPKAALEQLISKVKEVDVAEATEEPPAVPGASKNTQKPIERNRGVDQASTVEHKTKSGQSKAPIVPVQAGVPSGEAMAGLAEDHLLRRQGVTREFLEKASRGEGVMIGQEVLKLYYSLREIIRTDGVEVGLDKAKTLRDSWTKDLKEELKSVDPDSRSEIRAVWRAIDELLKPLPK